MIEEMDNGWWSTEFLLFQDKGCVSIGATTHYYTVTSRKNGSHLGYVRWYNPWRKYCFFPVNCVLDERCMSDISEFITIRTGQYVFKQKEKKPKARHSMINVEAWRKRRDEERAKRDASKTI